MPALHPTLTIIMPAHNAAAFLGATLERLAAELADVVDGVEVLLFNDGSSDATGEIARRFAADHAWLQVHDVAFCNVGRVRQAAVAAAQGDYVTFLDSDDAFADGAMAWLLDVLAGQSPDIVLTPLQEVSDPAARLASPSAHACRLIDRQTALDLFLEHRAVQGHLIGKCFARELLAAHPIAPLTAYEDLATLPGLLLDAKRIVLGLAPIYLYLKRAGSLSNRCQDWPRLGDQVQALALVDAALASHVSASRRGTFWVELANALLDSPNGPSLLTAHPDIGRRVLALPLWRYLLTASIRTSQKRKLLRVRRALRQTMA
ncbi:MAG: glycosyltransferase [Burkholderiales bacterium]|nr:glycosyltransferase [Burkholderiales bacterium]